jgi:hypothetical protein
MNITICEFCNITKKTVGITIKYSGNETWGFDDHNIIFQLCAQCVGENLTMKNGFAKVGA